MAELLARRPAVAGTFYPADPDVLRALVDGLLDEAWAAQPEGGGPHRQPKVLVAPHAGYVYSGPVAATAYARLRPWAEVIRKVVLLGPAHRSPVQGMATTSLDAWVTPLGAVPVDPVLRDRLVAHPAVHVDDAAHAGEHSLEVQLPFLQRVLGEVSLSPLLAGRCSAGQVADALELAWGGPETLVLVSTDLSHYHRAEHARIQDARTAAAVVAGAWEAIGPDDACGVVPLRGALELARRHGLDVEQVDLRNSADTAGPAERVVGYGAFAMC
jgi:AmmeMemoRadiSam system protein B